MNQLNYKLVIFDWEGTLSDSLGLMVDCLSQTNARFNAGELDRAKIMHYIGYDIRRLVQTLHPGWPTFRQQEFCDAYRYLHMQNIDRVKLFAGVQPLLSTLQAKGALMAIATGKSLRNLQLALSQTNTTDYFFALRTPDTCPSKPHPQMLNELIEQAGVNTSETVFIGDSVCDIECASNASVAAIGVDFCHLREQNRLLDAGAAIVVDSFAALTECLVSQKGA